MDKEKQKEMVKKAVVYLLLGILFCGSMYFIFKDSLSPETENPGGANTTVPSASEELLPGSKEDIYKEEEFRKEKNDRQTQGDELMAYFDQKGTPKEEREESQAELSKQYMEQRAAENHRIIAGYEDSYRALDEFRQQGKDASALSAMQRENEALKEQLRRQEIESKRPASDETERLLERAKAMENEYRQMQSLQAQAAAKAVAASAPPSYDVELPDMEVIPMDKNVVSSLSQPLPGEQQIREALQPKNGFSGIESEKSAVRRNTLRATVERTMTVRDGDLVPLRLSEPALMGGVTLPKDLRVIAKAKISGNRMLLGVTHIEYLNRIVSVKLSAFDADGQTGVFIPGSEDADAAKEIGADMAGSMGTSFTFSQSASDQIISEAARGLMGGVSKHIQKKARSPRVTLKGGYRLYLVQNKNG